MTSADEIRALAQSIHEATQHLAEATALLVELLADQAPQAQLPHSRACDIRPHDHGPACHSNCPSCGGLDLALLGHIRHTQEPSPVEPILEGEAKPMPRRCPECKAGKPDNCTVTLEDGDTLCADYRQRTFR